MFESTSKRIRTGVLLGALVFAAVPLTQAWMPGQDGRPGGLIPVDPPAGAGEPVYVPEKPGFDAEVWRAKLTDADLERREQAFGEAVAAARRSGGLRGWLEEAATGGDELAWTARLIQRELRAAPRRGPGAFSAPFAGDPFEQFFGGQGLRRPGSLGFGGPSIFDAFDDLFDAPGARGQGRSFGFRMGPNGVEVETSEDVDGDRRTEVYQADDLESLLEQHPELRERFGLAPQPVRQGLRTDILGVRVARTEPSDGLPEGLLVIDTVFGTVAHLLGVERGSVLLELNGRPLVEVADISAVLSSRPEGGELRLKWIDASGLETIRVWRPGEREDAEPEEREDF